MLRGQPSSRARFSWGSAYKLCTSSRSLYLVPRLGRSSELYGSLGAATVILLWLYIIARLVTLSAFLNATLWERRTAD